MSKALHCGVTGCSKELFKNQFCLEHYQKNQNAQPKKKPVLIMKNKETIDDLLDGVRKQQKFGRMVEYSIECLRKLAVDEVSVEEEIELGTIETLMDAILANPNNEKLHKMFMELLAQFAMNSRMAELVGNKLGHKYKLITDSFKKFKDPETSIASCNAILKLAEHDANIDDMVNDGILDSLNQLIKDNPHNPDVIAAAAACLEKFARRNRQYAQKIMDSGCVDVVINAMKEFPTHLPLAQAGSGLLAALAGSKPEFIEPLKSMGAVDALIAVIEAHPYDQIVLDNAARALKLLTGDSDMMHALNVVHGNMAADLETLKALTRIAALLLVDDNVDYMMQHNGIDWLISTMQGLAKDLSPMANKILTQGCLALARAANNENNIYAIMQAGGVKLLTSLIEGHIEDEGLVAAALTALLRMATRPENCVYIANCGGIKAALAAMKRWPKSEQVISPAVGLLSALAGVAEPGKQIVALGGIEALIQALKDHFKNPEICTSIIMALGKLANSQENVKKMADCGLLPLLVKLLNEHPTNLPLTRAVLGVMETCCLVPDNVKQLLTLGAVQAVKGAMHRHQDGEVQTTGQRVLDLLSGQQQQLQAQRDMEEAERRRKEQEERDRKKLEKEMADALARLKLEEEHAARLQREKDARERRAIELAEQQRKLKEDMKNQEMEHLKKLVAGQQKPKEVKKPAIEYKSARKVFADDESERKPVEFEEWAKQLLLAGALLTKHSKAAPPRARHVYLSADLKYLNWKKPGGQLKAKNRMPVTFIHEITKGCTTPQLQRTKNGKPMAKEELSFSVFGSDSDDHVMRTLDLEARTIAECDRWALAIQNLIDWSKSKKLYGATDTIHYQENDAVWSKDQAKPALYA